MRSCFCEMYSYFLRSEKNELTNNLMICLNFADILASLTSIISNFLDLVFYIYELGTGNDILVVLGNIAMVTSTTFNTIVIISGCLTFVLTLLRTIVICNPFYRIKQKLCVSCLVLIVVVLATLVHLLSFWTSGLPAELKPFGINALMVSFLFCCNIVMSVATIIVLKKTRGDGQQERNDAAVTMAIISMYTS